MDLDIITQYIIGIAPAITSVIGIVVSLIVGIKKIKKANKNTIDMVEANNLALRETNLELKSQLDDIHKENIELKKEMTHLLKKVNNVYEPNRVE